MVKKTNIYFHNFRNKRIPDRFDVLSLECLDETIETVCDKIKSILKINKNTPIEGYAVKDINKLRYSWLYTFSRTGYGSKRNFKRLNKNSLVSKYENILLNYHHSQFNEDYIIQKIFDKIGTSNKYFVEFGAWDGELISNTVLLRHNGWKGLLIESNNQLPSNLPNAVCFREYLRPDNIESAFKKGDVPKEFDFLSISVDGNDYYLWEALKNYKARLLCIEIDGESKNIKKLLPYQANTGKPKCSILVMTELSEKKGYKLIYNNMGNAFYLNNQDYFRYFKPSKLINWNEPYVATVDLF